MFHFGEKKRQRLLHNARCRRYYQRHLSKHAREEKIKAEMRKQRREALKRSTTNKDDTKQPDPTLFLL